MKTLTKQEKKNSHLLQNSIDSFLAQYIGKGVKNLNSLGDNFAHPDYIEDQNYIEYTYKMYNTVRFYLNSNHKVETIEHNIAF